MRDADLVVVGSGFGGSILAMIARRLGRRVLLLERGRHPRFAIGESASPLAGLMIEALADRYDLPRLRPLGSYGAWRRSYPGLACGLKRGFTFFEHTAATPFVRRSDRSNELLVAASPSDELADTHWYRAEVDHFLVQEAVSLHVEYQDQVSLDRLTWDASGDADLAGTRLGRPFHVRAHSVVDASGPNGFLVRALGVGTSEFRDYPRTQALFAHFRGVARCEDLPAFSGPPAAGRASRDDATETPPYPADDAAVHHVFDGGWMWVLRFAHGITSAGVAVTDALAAELRLSDGRPAWDRLLERYPSVADQFAAAEPVRDFTWMRRLSYRAASAGDGRWALLPSAAAFVDPLFSTGMPLTLLGIERLARLMETGAFAPAGTDRAGLGAAHHVSAYTAATLAEADHVSRFVAGCYRSFPVFADFTAYAMFYFAAASYGEMARRLGVPGIGFLGLDDPGYAHAIARFSSATPGICSAARASQIAAAVEPFNVAGLCDPRKRHWYGVDPEDTVRAAAKLGVTAADVRRALDRVKAGRLERPASSPMRQQPFKTPGRADRGNADTAD